jgi:hypothetical protein
LTPDFFQIALRPRLNVALPSMYTGAIGYYFSLLVFIP